MNHLPTELNLNQIQNAPLCDYTTFRLGGPCPLLVNCAMPEQLEQAIMELIRAQKKFILIGGGSNLVVSDSGLDAVVVRYYTESPIIRRVGSDIVVSGSTRLDDLVQFALENGLEGVNYASGIPGTVGGAIVGNAGAWGKQVGDFLKSVTLLTKDGHQRTVGPEVLGFTYRHSNLKETGEIVVTARFGLGFGDQELLAKEREEILKMRREKHPDLQTHPCAGSFFRNIEPTSQAERRQAAGHFLEQAGAKEFQVGGAKIFEKHANIIVKADGCKAQDVHDLSLKMAQAVKERFKLDLVREVRFVGEFNGKPEKVQDLIW